MSIEAMKEAVAAFDKIIDGCNSIDEEDTHPEAKKVARLVRKDCLRALEALCQAIAKAEKQEAVAWMWKDGTLTSDPDFADGTWTPLFTVPVHARDMSKEPVDETAKRKHEPVAWYGDADGFPVYTKPVVNAVRCTYPQCQATNGCVGVCSEKQPDLARVGEVGTWGDK